MGKGGEASCGVCKKSLISGASFCSTLKRKVIESGIPMCVHVCVCEQKETEQTMTETEHEWSCPDMKNIPVLLFPMLNRAFSSSGGSHTNRCWQSSFFTY